jgi:hypothetical protein
MRYQKPEIVLLGTSSELILASKFIAGFESISPFTRRSGADSELDD